LIMRSTNPVGYARIVWNRPALWRRTGLNPSPFSNLTCLITAGRPENDLLLTKNSARLA